MEEVIKIEGWHRFTGQFGISGSKNSMWLLIPACVSGTRRLPFTVPNISTFAF